MEGEVKVVPIVIEALGAVSDMSDLKWSRKRLCWEQLDYYGKFWPFRVSNVRSPLGALRICCCLLLAPKGNLPGNVN